MSITRERKTERRVNVGSSNTCSCGGCTFLFSLRTTTSSCSSDQLLRNNSHGCKVETRERDSSIHHQMDLHKLIHSCVVCFMVLVLLLMKSAQSTVVLIHFDRAPPALSRFSNAVFQYSIEGINGSSSSSNPCKTEHECSIYCELDGEPLKHCPAGRRIIFQHLTPNDDHIFLLNVTTLNGDKNSSAYKWFIDTIPPTATINSENSYTNAEKTAIDITFSEACRGFKCINTSSCDVSVDGPAYIDASTLQEVEPNIKYRVILASLTATYGRVVIKMANNFCTDQAGNRFRRSNGSIIVVHFDRRPIEVQLWTSVPSYELEINEVPRTVLATNKTEDLEIFVDFSDPVVNSTKDIQSVLDANVGNVVPIHSRSHNNRRFGFKLKDVLRTKAITVKLLSASIIGRSGSPASSVSPISFLYDSGRPGVKLTTRSPEVAKESDINVMVEFTEPVFGFQPSDIEVVGGSITRFKELKKALYSLVILGKSQSVVSVLVPQGKARDVAGNLNLASNRLEVRQYSTPTISVALHSFVTAGLLTTSLAAVLLRLSCTNIAAIGALTSGTTNVANSDPSMNLLGMVGHLQVFVLSEWIAVRLPLEYFETTKGLRWLIPREELPWKKKKSVWANYDFPSEGHNELPVRPRNLSTGLPFSDEIANHSIQHSSNKTSSYGLPLDSVEYSIYFMREKPSAGINVERVENYTGWKDLEMNLFWLGIGGGSLLISHLSTLLFLRWRTGTSVHGTLSAPRFELVILILLLPCISQSSAFVIRGGTTGGIIVGAALLAIPAALILSVCMFLTVVIFTGSFVQYKEIIITQKSEPWLAKMLPLLIGKPTAGKWFYREGLPSSFLPRFGFLFEDRKGPPVYVTLNQNDLNNVPKWVDSGKTGIGRMRVVNFDGVNEEPKIPMSKKLVGCARSGYLILDLLRRVALGIISGAYSSPRPSQSIIAFSVTLVQFLYLFTLKPYIRRGVHVVESISLLCEAAIFGLSIYMSHWNSFKERTIGFLMLVLLFISFFAQLVNEWYALIKCLLRISQSRNLSFKLGVKSVTKGLVLPFLPKKHWSKLLSRSSQPKTGLVSVLPLSPERENGAIRINSFRAMTATIVPILSPGSPNHTNIQATGSVTAQKVEGQKRMKEVKLETKSELKKLRELARASFSGWIEEGSSSYAPREECDSNGSSSSDNIQVPSPNNNRC